MATFFYDRCQNCKRLLKVYMRPNALRIGPEVLPCVCGLQYRSGLSEWANLSPKQKRHYFISEGAVGLLLMGAFLGGIFSIMDSTPAHPKPFHFDWIGSIWGVLAGLTCTVVLWIGKGIKIWESLRRHPSRNLFSTLRKHMEKK